MSNCLNDKKIISVIFKSYTKNSGNKNEKLTSLSAGFKVSGSATGSSSASSSVCGSEMDSCSGGSVITPTLPIKTAVVIHCKWKTKSQKYIKTVFC